jgi:LemA protein
MSDELWIVVSVLGLMVVAALTAMGIYNRLVRSQVRTKEAWSGIDVQLRRRSSLVPNLVETVRGYASHERSLLEEVTRARNGLQNAQGAIESAEANRDLTAALGRLLAVVEASSNFQDFQDRLADVEEKIAYARHFYNGNVARFNIQIRAIPDVLIARMLRLQRFDFFEADEGTREDVQVSFGSPLAATASGAAAEE